MASDDVNLRGVTKEYKDDRGKGVLIPSAALGIVKNNVDPTHSGRLEVYLKRMGASDSDNPAYWTTVRYLSPFFGYTPNTGSSQSYGDYVGNPNSYGFWATPPDIGTEVVCVFLNGDPNEGYYIGSIPQPGLTQMVPGIGAVDNVIPNKGEASSYGGATRLPVGESNNANDKQANSTRQSDNPRPVHSYQAAILNKQGLLRDPDRGPISSSSMRESPSRVFGMSTPGRPIYDGGYTDETIGKAAATSTGTKGFQVVARRGGHTFVMDDGTYDGRDNLTRLRTAGGHTILMNDSAQTLFIIHSNGQSYIELGKEGTIDMYSTNSVNIRTQGDLNLHADRNININAGKDLNINAENIQVESEKATNMFAGTNFAQNVKGNFTNKVDGGMSLASQGPASFASAGTTFVNGPNAVNLNTGSSSLQPQAVKQVPKIKHTDTLYDEKVGFAAAPGKLTSITSRAPAHAPWADANKGVDAKSNLSASANYPESPSTKVEAANAAAPAAPKAPTTTTLAATVPNTATTAPNQMNKNETGALTSAVAVNAATGSTATAVAQTAGTVTANGTTTAVLGATAMTPSQLAAAGNIKPGMETAINAAVAAGKPLNEAIPANAWTGKDGVNNLNDFLNSKSAQVNATTTVLNKSEEALVEKGVITGKESITQKGGLIVATASAGPDNVSKFVNAASTLNTSNLGLNPNAGLGGIAASAAGLYAFAKKTGESMTPGGLNTSLTGSAVSTALPGQELNAVAGSIPNLVAAGKLAANLADKNMSGLPSAPESPEGASKGLFDKIVSSFKPIKAGIPQNLTTINAKNQAEKEATESTKPETTPAEATQAATDSKSTGNSMSTAKLGEILSGAFGAAQKVGTSIGDTPSNIFASGTALYNLAKETGSKLPGSAPSAPEAPTAAAGVDALAGGAKSLSNNIQGDIPSSVPGTGSVKDFLGKITGNATGPFAQIGGVIDNMKSKIGANTSLASFASIGLSEKDMGALNGALNSVSAGGATEVKLPTTAEGTNDVGGLIAQSKSLLGNDKIPPLNFGGFKPKILTPAETAKYDKLKAELDVLNDTKWDLQKVYYDYKSKYGASSTEAVSAKQAYDKCLADIKKLNQEMLQITTA